MLQWDFSFSFGYLPLQHNNVNKLIITFTFTFSVTHFNFTQLLLWILDLLDLSFPVVVEWLFCILWFTSESIHMFTIIVCTSYIYNCFSRFYSQIHMNLGDVCSLPISILGLPAYILYSYMSLNLMVESHITISIHLFPVQFFCRCLSLFRSCRLSSSLQLYNCCTYNCLLI